MKKLRHPRYLLFLLVLIVAGGVFTFLSRSLESLIAAFDIAVLAFILSCVHLWRIDDPNVVRREAERDDVGQGVLLVLTALISSVALVAIALLIRGRNELGALGVGLVIATLLASWTFTNLVYAFHYARLYYSKTKMGDHKGLRFPDDATPDFSDFVNFAFVMGMTFQAADIDITHNRMRRISTFHALFAFAFNLGVLALAVNVLASGS